MALDYLTPDEVADEYLITLKSLKPTVNIDQTDSDWWIRSQVLGGVISGIYADQRKIADDAFPQSARTEALERHLNTYFGSGFRSATSSAGTIKVTGTPASTVPLGTELVYTPNGNTYLTQAALTLVGASGTVAVASVGTGQNQNLIEGASLSFSSTPAGIDSTAEVFGGDVSDGRDAETNEEAAARILARIRAPVAGGTESDYIAYALEASVSVTSASVIRYIYGLGTVGLVITSGTTDIDAAVDAGDPIVRVPSESLKTVVKDYVDARNPINDCLYVFGPDEASVDVTMNVRWADGYEGSQVLAGQTLTLTQLVEREIKRAIYKVPVGGRKIGASGYVIASEIEEALDQALSALPYAQGTIAEAIIDRQIEDLTATGTNRLVRNIEIFIPGTITVNEL
jgi:uncharacterized phage protein gp47/JayE